MLYSTVHGLDEHMHLYLGRLGRDAGPDQTYLEPRARPRGTALDHPFFSASAPTLASGPAHHTVHSSCSSCVRLYRGFILGRSLAWLSRPPLPCALFVSAHTLVSASSLRPRTNLLSRSQGTAATTRTSTRHDEGKRSCKVATRCAPPAQETARSSREWAARSVVYSQFPLTLQPGSGRPLSYFPRGGVQNAGRIFEVGHAECRHLPMYRP